MQYLAAQIARRYCTAADDGDVINAKRDVRSLRQRRFEKLGSGITTPYDVRVELENAGNPHATKCSERCRPTDNSQKYYALAKPTGILDGNSASRDRCFVPFSATPWRSEAQAQPQWSNSDLLAPKVTKDVYEYLFRDGKRPDYREAARALHEAVGRAQREGAWFNKWIPFIHLGL